MKTKFSFFYILSVIVLLQFLSVSASEAVIKIMPLGDSITEGSASDANPDDSDHWVSYRKLLWDQLITAGYDIDFVGSVSGGDLIPDFDPDHEGHGGWSDDDIVFGNPSNTGAGKLADWLADQQPDIVLLHIGTNDLQTNADAVESILDEIDAYSPDAWVVLARIINRNCSLDFPVPCVQSVTTTTFNDNVEDMALDRITNPANPAFPDRIILVDMEDGAGFDYRVEPDGDMANNLHPFATGYTKMAGVWLSTIQEVTRPVAFADADQTTVEEGAQVTLDGTGSSDPDAPIDDPDSTISYAWTQPSGPAVTITNANTAIASFTAPEVDAGGADLTFRLTVTDIDSLTDSQNVTIHVENTLTDPTAEAGNAQSVSEGASVTLNGFASDDPDGTIVAYLWEKTAGPAVTITNPNTAMATFTAPDVTAAGATLVFKLTVTDNDGLTATDSVSITVNNIAPPLAEAGNNQNVSEAASVTLNGSASSDPDGNIVRYDWTQTSGSAVAIVDDDPATPTATFIAPDVTAAGATLVFKLTVTDNNGLTATDSVSITVNNIAPPLAEAGNNQNVSEGASVTLNGSASSDPDGNIVRYDWTQTSGSAVAIVDDDPATPTATFIAPDVTAAGATLVFKLTVTDNNGLTATDSVSITVNNIAPPLAEAGNNQNVSEGASVTLNGSASSDPDGNIVRYDWTQTSGSAVTFVDDDPATPTVTFTAPRVDLSGEILTFRLTVRDNDGLESTDELSVTIKDLISPIARAGKDQTVKEGETVTLNGSASSDLDGTVLVYEWKQISGIPVEIGDAFSTNLTFTAPNVDIDGETLTFQLIVQDNDGLIGTDEISIYAQILPRANAGSDQTVHEGEIVTLYASDSVAPAGETLTYYWTQTAGTLITLSDTQAAQPTFTAPNINDETLYFELTIVDDDGHTSKANVHITVVCETASTPNSISFSSIDEDGSFTVSWSFQNKTATYILQRATNIEFSDAIEVYNGTSTFFLQTGLGDGTYYYRVSATNNCGNSEWQTNENGLVVSASRDSELASFVTRFYTLCLGRNSDQAGLDGWVDALRDGMLTGSDVGYGFVFSHEFGNQNITDQEYVQILYRAFFDRQADAEGLQGWLYALAAGCDRTDVLNGFIFATEFAELCDEFGIKPYEGYNTREQRESVEAFVSRFYQLCLEREPDAGGLQGWTDNLLNRIQTGADVANGFIYSQEFINKNTNNVEYLTILYQAFFNRDPDKGGWDAWIAGLNKGEDRGNILDGFLGSQEFIKLCNDFGINPF